MSWNYKEPHIRECFLCGAIFEANHPKRYYCYECHPVGTRGLYDRSTDGVTGEELFSCYLSHPGEFHEIVGPIGKRRYTQDGHWKRRR